MNVMLKSLCSVIFYPASISQALQITLHQGPSSPSFPTQFVNIKEYSAMITQFLIVAVSGH